MDLLNPSRFEASLLPGTSGKSTFSKAQNCPLQCIKCSGIAVCRPGVGPSRAICLQVGMKDLYRLMSTAARCCAGISLQTPGLSQLAAGGPQLSGAVSLEKVGVLGRQRVLPAMGPMTKNVVQCGSIQGGH